MDVMVLETQHWLNTTYGDVPGWVTLEENGSTGWNTIYGLIRGLQHELGITDLAPNFGTTTSALFQDQIGRIDAESDTDQSILKLVNGGLWCKGYYGVSMLGDITFDDLSGSISQIRSDLGLTGNYIDVKLMKSLLSMDAYVIPIGSSGTSDIREAQQWLNGKYVQRRDFSIIPCDGIFSRGVLTGLLFALQYEIGMDDETANGNFGPGTKAGIESYATVGPGSTDTTHSYVHLCQCALRFNRCSSPLNGQFDTDTKTSISEFQSFMALPSTGTCNYPTWCSLLVSCGDDTQATRGFDTNRQLTLQQLLQAKAEGYTHIGRYTVGAEKYITAQELEALKESGFLLFPIHQRFNNSTSEMNLENGLEQGLEALQRGRALGLPANSTIFFCVDYDPPETEIDANVSSFFQGVNASLGSAPNWTFKVGVYGTRNVCSRIIRAGLATTAFVAGSSWGWSGNMGFTLPENWSYNQIGTSTLSGQASSVEIDKVVVAQEAEAISLSDVSAPPSWQEGEPLSGTRFNTWFEWCINAEIAVEQAEVPALQAAEVILSYLRKPKYWNEGEATGLLWRLYTPEQVIASRSAAENNMSALSPSKPLDNDYRGSAHWAASTLGHLLWGASHQADIFSLGDLGGWGLDLVTLWGDYLEYGQGDSLAEWMEAHLAGGPQTSRMDYSDTIADIDAYLTADSLLRSPTTRLSDVLREQFKMTVAERCNAFFEKRFASSAANIAEVFDYYCNSSEPDIIAAGLAEVLNVIFDIERRPNSEECAIITEAFANKLNTGLR